MHVNMAALSSGVIVCVSTQVVLFIEQDSACQHWWSHKLHKIMHVLAGGLTSCIGQCMLRQMVSQVVYNSACQVKAGGLTSCIGQCMSRQVVSLVVQDSACQGRWCPYMYIIVHVKAGDLTSCIGQCMSSQGRWSHQCRVVHVKSRQVVSLVVQDSACQGQEVSLVVQDSAC